MSDKQVHVQNSRPRGASTDHLSLEQVLEYFVDLHYPASKPELLAHAAKHDAPQETLALIERFPDQQYNSSRDLMKVINQVN
jgi:hypothetical protein